MQPQAAISDYITIHPKTAAIALDPVITDQQAHLYKQLAADLLDQVAQYATLKYTTQEANAFHRNAGQLREHRFDRAGH